jgi:hypothetical protein
MKEISWYWVLAFCLVMFVGVIAARGVLGDRYEVKINDILVLVLPFLLWLFATGQISSFELGGEKLAIKAVFAEAGSRPIYGLVSKIPVQSVSTADKGTLSEIPALLEKKSPGSAAPSSDHRALKAGSARSWDFQSNFGGHLCPKTKMPPRRVHQWRRALREAWEAGMSGVVSLNAF